MITAGLWDFNLYMSSNRTYNQVTIYPMIYHVDVSGNSTLISDNSNNLFTMTLTQTNTLTSFSAYVPTIILPNLNYRIRIDFYVSEIFSLINDYIIMSFRGNNTLSHTHTTLNVISNIVDTLTNQTIGGLKTFTNDMLITSTTESTNITTGALIVKGGVGIGGNLYVNGNINHLIFLIDS